eukprot:gene11963-13876_t
MSVDRRRAYIIEQAVKEDAEEIARVVNDAYAMQNGNTGYAFKKESHPRIADPYEDWLVEAYEKGQIITAVNEQSEIVGMIYIKQLSEKLFFGPFAVRSDMKMQGIGTLLLEEVFKLAAELKSKCIEIKVVNHRTDNIPMYEKLGFSKIGEEDFPDPESVTRPTKLLIYQKQLL